MSENNKSVWTTFRLLAQQYPECQATKLTLEMQRWHISQQQQLIQDGLFTLLWVREPIVPAAKARLN